MVNVNLAIKALCGIEAFAIICQELGKHNLACSYAKKAATFAAKLKSLVDNDVMPLAYGQKNTYSLKYNILFDKLFGFDLVDPDTFVIVPHIPKDPESAVGSFQRADGALECGFKRKNDNISFHIGVPIGMHGTFDYGSFHKELTGGDYCFTLNAKTGAVV